MPTVICARDGDNGNHLFPVTPMRGHVESAQPGFGGFLRRSRRSVRVLSAYACQNASWLVPAGFIVLNRDCQAAERELKQLLERIRRLSGKRLVTAAGRVVTAYRAGKATERRLVRGAEEREFTA